MIKIFEMDAFKFLNKLENESVDLFFTDPPYNTGNKRRHTMRYVEKDGKKIQHLIKNEEAFKESFNDTFTHDDYLNFLEKLLKVCFAKLKNGGSFICFLSYNYTSYFLYIAEQVGFYNKNKFYFVKTNPQPHFQKTNYRATAEEAIWVQKGKKSLHFTFISQREMRNVFSGSIGRKITKHPTEKYKWMVEPLILRHSNVGSLIVDPFCGSGAILKVAKDLNRDYLGCDINLSYLMNDLK